ncbi:hypothetical protein GCM10012288_09330 [Malaciobacter pacificus]|uniref:Uncharacterized protein n=1 Tax=Malaciobacter pacificus TaxID=1080223 RepID=A0A5C2H6N8_9BACT|nr:hypothetical protein [Malaciobacter pacificus]QEP34617.1 hypothetical protein APAC_1509 [Malaciobacter pacificus]GGD37349.1 hypothetical protein GCM10012288_09330 [Malaciobacter pacificus]
MKKFVFITLTTSLLTVSSFARDVIFSIYEDSDIVKTDKGCISTIWTGEEGSIELVVNFDKKTCNTIKKDITYIMNVNLEKCKELKSIDSDKYACNVNKIKEYNY